MTRSFIKLMMCLVGTCLAAMSLAGETKSDLPAPYPFNESKPKIPKEIIADARLDQKLDVFVKSSNMKELCAALSRETGVRIMPSRDIAGERPVIYFHHRPVRDVMTELSGLYGFFWLVKGKEGSYSYELFEDSRHAQKREKAKTGKNDALNAALMDAIDQGCAAMDDPATLQKMAKDSVRLFESVARPDLRAFLELICKMDRSAIWGYLKGDKVSRFFPEFSADQQEGLVKFINARAQRIWEDAQKQGKTAPEPQVKTIADMDGVVVTFKQAWGKVGGPPHVFIRMDSTKSEMGAILQEWPMWEWDDTLKVEEIGPGQVIGDALSHEQKIKGPKFRKLWYASGLLVNDMLEAIGTQTDLDIICDFYLQHELDGFQEMPLDELVTGICKNFDYTCQVEGKMLRFRHNRWFDREPLVEPPADLLNRLWKHVDANGTVGYDDILDIASLPDQQMVWHGFRFIPGAQMAQRAPGTLKLWAALSPSFRFDANQTATVLVTDLTAQQQDTLYTWVKLMGCQQSIVDVAKSVITVAITGNESKSYELYINFPDGKSRSMKIDLANTFPPISEELRKDLAAQRRADADADKVVLVK